VVDEAEAMDPEPSQDGLDLGPIRLERGHGRGDDEIPRSPARRRLHLGQELAKECVRRFARGDGNAADAGQGAEGLGGERRLEGRDE